MGKKIFFILIVLGTTTGIFITACTYHKKELVYPPIAPCDTLDVTYSKTIIPLFSSYCYECHSGTATNGNGVMLDKYNILRGHSLFGNLLKMVQHQPGVSAMPKDRPKLSDCNIAKIRKWIEAGAPNN